MANAGKRVLRAARFGHQVSELTSEDRARVVREFGETYGRVGWNLVRSPRASLRDLAHNVECMFRMLVDRELGLSWKTTAMIVFALAYFISPFDLIPDSAVVVGYLDDALLVAEVALLLSSDIARWKALRGLDEPAVKTSRRSGRPTGRRRPAYSEECQASA